MLSTSSRTKPTTKARGRKTAAAKLNAAKYRKLVASAMPAVIETEAENKRLLAIIEPMMSRKLTPEEGKLFDLLTKLIHDFEEIHYPMGESSPAETLRFLMEQRDLRQRDILHLFGSSGIV